MNLRMSIAQILVFSLIQSSFLSAASKPHAGDTLRQRIEQFGVGTELKVKLADGTRLRGRVDKINQESFSLVAKDDGVSREIAYSDLDKLGYPKRGYKAEGTPDPAAAKRMVVQLGVGEHIMVKVEPGHKVRGHIREINDNYFVVQPDGQTQIVQVPYGNIQKVNKNLSFGATVAIVVGIAAAAVLILVLSGEEDVDLLPD